jgi:hypothetical protein
MKNKILVVIAVAVSSVGFLLGRTSAKTSLAESEQGTAPVNCAIPRTNGTFKSVMTFSTTVWMVFEDAGGTIRFIDENCQVRSKFARQ